jgi:hypothetical protein
MTRSRTALAGLAACVLLLGACSRNKDATQGDVKDDVVNQMLDPGYISGEGADPVPVEQDQAEAIGTCVSETLFNPEVFTKEERNAAANSFDADPPDPDLVLKVEHLVNSCYADAVGDSGSSSSDSSDSSSDDAETTTTGG